MVVAAYGQYDPAVQVPAIIDPAAHHLPIPQSDLTPLTHKYPTGHKVQTVLTFPPGGHHNPSAQAIFAPVPVE